jgi:Flp pilus assembly protein TadB
LKLLWMIIAGICIVTAAVFLLRGDFNTAFVVAVIGLVSWFLNYRTQARESLTAEELQESNDQEGGDNSDENQDSGI